MRIQTKIAMIMSVTMIRYLFC